ncbi:SHNi-TPR domain-containing protein [Aspergillus saccharolyticus JOP 1030-1]|uniref:Tetratricopeptide SHNi-TPR domain-containing protein n=1 Tax=Aspergillus saccharolyticus JOP 1030-1 TaxID=1450539 RepID=A0A318ZLG3_9EURO|nr:hypothetical protein BP01DRAFT_363530 [Aspergillus saccharolyticus JOP 1030-1]PYH47717.1 hypothetical protein BP01DRAFT_363530 [Aspergillus saccharolyticus JOP 1030-1]
MSGTSELDITSPRAVCGSDDRASLDDLIGQAAAKDAIKDFHAAAELYSEATEIQAKLNGELALENADLLFAYGRALYNVAVSKSDVLGSKVATEGAPSHSNDSKTVTQNVVEDAIAQAQAAEMVPGPEIQLDGNTSRPYFQFTGDENFDESDTEDEVDNAVAEEDEDDFANAYEVLDLARILYQKKLNAMEEDGKGKSAEQPMDLKQVKERLADTYDLQAEISLEAERFIDAVADLRIALSLRQSLFPMEDPSVAECHYKLSLALEFASVDRADNDGQAENDKVDEGMRKEAVTQMEHAIESCRVRMVQEQMKLVSDSSLNEDKAIALKRKIDNVKDIISDMEQRLIDLQRPAASSVKAGDMGDSVLKGILGQIVGQPLSEQQARLDAVTKNANDLSAFVKRKSTAGSSQSQSTESVRKRTAEDETHDCEPKRARMPDIKDIR